MEHVITFMKGKYDDIGEYLSKHGINDAMDDSQKTKIEPIEKIIKRFGSGAMSFGSISAESQRDLILAFKEMDGRSNSGEGGENPYYFELTIVLIATNIPIGLPEIISGTNIIEFIKSAECALLH